MKLSTTLADRSVKVLAEEDYGPAVFVVENTVRVRMDGGKYRHKHYYLDMSREELAYIVAKSSPPKDI